MSQLSIYQQKHYDPYNPQQSNWDREALIYTPPTESTLRAAYRAQELAEEGERLVRAEKKSWYTNIGGYEITKKPTGSAAYMMSGKKEGEPEEGEAYWYLPETTRKAAMRARQLEIEARKADYARNKSYRFTWIGGLPIWAKKDATVPDYMQQKRGVGMEVPI